MLLFGRLMVTLHPAGPFWVAVPPGHSAESKTPPLLLLTVNVKSWLPHVQTPLVPHTLLAQSLPASHSSPSAQSGQLGPPQSTSVSLAFRTPSVQVGTWHTPPLHTWLEQSLGALQPAPSPQRIQEGAGPPQSTSVSLPFSTPSAQFGTLQKPALQTPLGHSVPLVQVGWQMPPEHPPIAQSVPRKHASPVAHPGQLPPPQSRAVSLPFLTPSVQVGA
jgi:hypothetical protein